MKGGYEVHTNNPRKNFFSKTFVCTYRSIPSHEGEYIVLTAKRRERSVLDTHFLGSSLVNKISPG